MYGWGHAGWVSPPMRCRGKERGCWMPHIAKKNLILAWDHMPGFPGSYIFRHVSHSIMQKLKQRLIIYSISIMKRLTKAFATMLDTWKVLLSLETMHVVVCRNGTHATLYSCLHHVSVLFGYFLFLGNARMLSGCIVRKYTMECLS